MENNIVLQEVYWNIVTRSNTWAASRTKDSYTKVTLPPLSVFKNKQTNKKLNSNLDKMVIWDTSPPSSWSAGFANKVTISCPTCLSIYWSVMWQAGEGNGTPLQYSCLENPMDGGAWQTAVHGVSKSQTRLSDFTFTFHFHALEKEMTIHSSVLAWRIPGMGDPGGLLSVGSHRVEHD